MHFSEPPWPTVTPTSGFSLVQTKKLTSVQLGVTPIALANSKGPVNTTTKIPTSASSKAPANTTIASTTTTDQQKSTTDAPTTAIKPNSTTTDAPGTTTTQRIETTTKRIYDCSVGGKINKFCDDRKCAQFLRPPLFPVSKFASFQELKTKVIVKFFTDNYR